MEYTLEKSVKVYNNKNGDYVYVGPDGDLVELRLVPKKGRGVQRLSLQKEQAILVAKGILELYGEKR